MIAIPANIKTLVFEKDEDEDLAADEQAMWADWISGRALESLTIDVDDPDFFDMLRLYHKWEQQKEDAWRFFERRYLRRHPLQPAYETTQPATRSLRTYIWVAAAVVATLVIGVVTWRGFINTTAPANNKTAETKPAGVHTVQPGGKKAVLTLADGSTQTLDASSAGLIVRQDGMEIRSQAGGELIYSTSNTGKTHSATAGNTLTTPIGGEYAVVLSDGSKVWLNAGSSLRYPTSFNSDQRRVELSGEAYFEVTKDKTKPFIVSIMSSPGADNYRHDSQVEVLGTRFNVKAYTTEGPVTTTLVQGKVLIRHGNNALQIFPNQQAIVTGETIQLKKNVAADQVIAWKNGYINLDGETVESIMRQIGRWYNVNTNADKSLENDLTGKLSKSNTLDDLTKRLNEASVNNHFELKGQTLVAVKK